MIKTICLQIGNSDDKLSQAKWSEFVKRVQELIDTYKCQIWFFGGRSGCGGAFSYDPWQNACWVFSVGWDEESKANFMRELTRLRIAYYQDSVAVMEGVTQFV